MPQFKRTLFATSYFGKSYAFTGEYFTRIIDTGEIFSGNIDLLIKADLPEAYYPPTEDIFTKPKGWTLDEESKLMTSNSKEALTIFICCDKFTLEFDESSTGNATINIKDDNMEIIHTEVVNTTETKSISREQPYANYWLEIIPENETDTITVKGVGARVATISAEVYTSPTYHSQDPSTLTNRVEVDFTNGLEPNSQGFIEARTKVSVTDQGAVGVKLIMGTSDMNPDTTPVIDYIRISSGDVTKYSESGSWQCAINMNNVASDEGVTFSRTKRVDYSTKAPEAIEENINWMENYLPIRSAGKDLTSVGDETIPTDLEVRGSFYWSPETATYRKYKNTVSSRISLGHRNNGFFSENKEYGTVLLGPITKANYGYINTKITDWSYLMNAFSFPVENNGVMFKIQVWDTPKTDIYLPVYEETVTYRNMAMQLPINLTQLYEEIYIGIVLYSTTGTQSPVIDSMSLYAKLEFDKILHYKDNVSGLDNMMSDKKLPEAPNGTKHLRTLQTSIFQVPENAINKTYTLKYTPKYPNQQFVYYGQSNGHELDTPSVLGDVQEIKLYSLVTPDEPVASTNDVRPDRLYWHYQYDGGTVSYPHSTKKEIGTDFTPNLLQGKKYRLGIINGWPNEQVTLPRHMTWEEIAELGGSTVEKLKEINPNIIMYNNKIQSGTVIQLENTSSNEVIKMIFQSNNKTTSEKSLWNGSSDNDFIVSSLNQDLDYVTEWVSEERYFAGVINPNNEPLSYIRTQSLGLGGETSSKLIRNTTNEPIDYKTISQKEEVALSDLLLANNLLNQYGNADKVFVQPGDTYIVPALPTLPEIEPNVWYEGDNPYVVEIVPGTLRKTFDGIQINDDNLIAGSDDEAPIQYTLEESEAKEHVLTRGEYSHGRDSLPYANVKRILSIKNNQTGVTYTPYSSVGNNHIGDYVLEGNMISWAPDHLDSKEPKTGERYTVRFTNNIVQDLKIIYTSNYNEKLSFNKLWRSPEIKEVEAVVTPDRDVWLELPSPEEYLEYSDTVEQVDYVVEDSDLWVNSSLVDTDEGPMIRLSFDGKDPKRNWFPTINKGFYYLNDQEYYMYSEPIQHYFDEEYIPVIEEVHYNSNGLSMNNIETTEYLSNSSFSSGYLSEWEYLADEVTVTREFNEGYIANVHSKNPEVEPAIIKRNIESLPGNFIIELRVKSISSSPVDISLKNETETLFTTSIQDMSNKWQTYTIHIEDFASDSGAFIELSTLIDIQVSKVRIYSM